MGNLSQRSELTERDVSYITLHTNLTRKQIEEFHRRFLTFYPRGYATFEQFCELYSNELKHLRHARPFLERLFERIDTDQNRRLNFKEILFFKAITLPEMDAEEKLHWIFLFYDRNDDRFIDQEEFVDLCHLVHHIHGHSLTNDRLNELRILFDKFDLNHDRQLDSDEFIRLCKECGDLLQLMTPMFGDTKWNCKKDDLPTYPTTDELTSSQIDYLIQRTKFSPAQIERYYERFRTHCQSGRLSQSEFIDFYHQLFPSQTSKNYSELIFRAFDHLSKDGYIQFDEFLLALYIHSNASTSREKLEWLYNAYDRDGNGTIDYDEITQIVQALFVLYGIDREKYSVAYVAYEIMVSLDLNEDDRISKQEFFNMLKDEELTKFLSPSFVKQK